MCAEYECDGRINTVRGQENGNDISDDDEDDDKVITYTRTTLYPLHIIVVTAVTVGMYMNKWR